MAYRYLIYSTGTTYSGTILKDNGLVVPTPSANTASFYTDFAIPEIQPLYLWQVDSVSSPTTLIPNSDSNVNNYENAIAPPPQANDLVVYSELTGATAAKIDKVTGQTGKISIFTADGNLQSGGYTIPQLTGLTTYTFVESGGTQITQVGNQITIYTAVPTGTTVSWGTIVGNISNQTDLWANLTYLSGATTGLSATKLDKSVFNAYTGTSQPILNKALTGVTNLGTGSTLGGVSGRNVTIKSISVLGGLQVLGDANNLIISGATTLPTTWGSITGTLSNQTDLWNTLTGMTAETATKLDTSVFNGFTGTTLPANYYNKTQINNYTGQTSNLIATKVDKVTGATANNIPTFVAGGNIQDSGKCFTTTVAGVGSAVDTKVPTELAVRNAINSAIVSAIVLQGDWNATTNVPDLTVTGITTGFAWRVSVSGTTSLGGINYWQVGDMAIKSATGWIRTVAADISAVWGNISGTLSNQTDLQNALNAKQNTITGAATSITGSNLTINRALISDALGKVAVSPVTSTELSYLTGTTSNIQTQLNSKLNTSVFNTFTGTTLPANYYNKTEINSYTAQTQTEINSKLDTSVFTGYTASTKNKDKKIQLVSTSTLDVNVVTPTGVTWSSAPYSADTYLWSASSAITVYIKSAGTYEIQYHALLKNSSANQTHSIGGYIVKNGTTLPNTATAAMIIGPNNSGELSLPPVVQTFANNDKLVLTLFRIGNSGTVNLVANSTILMINKLT